MNTGQRQFRQVAAGQQNETWKIQATEKNGFNFDPNGNNILEGYFSEEKEIAGRDGKPFVVVTITKLNLDGSVGEPVDVIADTVLKDRLSKIQLNSYVCLTYLGRAFKKGYPAGQWSQTNSYHNWSVGVDDNAIPFNQLSGGRAVSQRIAQQPVAQVAQQQVANQFNPQQAFQNFQAQSGNVTNQGGQQFVPVAQAQQAPVAVPTTQQQQWTPPVQQFQQQATQLVATPNVFGGVSPVAPFAPPLDNDDLPF